jgi:hypothetical protein
VSQVVVGRAVPPGKPMLIETSDGGVRDSRNAAQRAQA